MDTVAYQRHVQPALVRWLFASASRAGFLDFDHTLLSSMVQNQLHIEEKQKIY